MSELDPLFDSHALKVIEKQENQINELYDRIERLRDDKVGLEDELSDMSDRAERAELTVRELLDRLADHRAGILTLTEVLAGPMLREVLTSRSPQSGFIFHVPCTAELWTAARDLELESAQR